MQTILTNLKVAVHDEVFLKDPLSSELGKKIIEHGIELINEIGFDNFTFKKLGERIGSNESSIYRYFENKHRFLIYLTSWYWGWVEYRLVFETNSIGDPVEKLTKALETVTRPVEQDVAVTYVNEVLLSKIVISEFSKSYLTKEVDEENQQGFFTIYKRLITRLADMVIAVNPEYSYPKSLMSTVIEGSLHQHFLKDHMKSITNCNQEITPTHFFKDLVFNAIRK